jgi:hypothetical protein
LRVDPNLICLYISSFYFKHNFVVYEFNFEHLIGLRRTEHRLYAEITTRNPKRRHNTLWTHRCSAFTKDLPVIKIRVAHPFSVLKMGTYAVNIYWWLMCKLTVPQRTVESKTNMQYIFKIICILQSLYTGRKILKG